MIRKARLSVHTFGCKLNQYESALMTERLCEDFAVSYQSEKADVFLFNSCTVTGEAERKLRQRYRSLRKRNPDSLFVVTGCYSELSSEELQELGFDAVVKNKDKTTIETSLRLLLGNNGYHDASVADCPVSPGALEGRTRAYISVEDGCRNKCSYCRVRLARGSEIRSKPLTLVKREFENLISGGFKEVVITGLNICFYGEDNNSSLLDLLTTLEEIDGSWRIRLSSLHPAFVGSHFLEYIVGNPRFAQHLHLSLQSGSDRILSLMNRGYNRKSFLSLVDSARKLNPYIAVTTDIITGFPSETEDDFYDTCSVVEEVAFLKTHIFRFSPRPGTEAAYMADQVPEQTKRERAKRLANLSTRSSLRYLTGSLGHEREVLVEKVSGVNSSGTDEFYVSHCTRTGAVGQFLRVVPEEICWGGVEQNGSFHLRSMVIR